VAKARPTKRRGHQQQEPGCEQRWGRRPCRPINCYWILSPEGRLVELRQSCACGKRFKPKEFKVGYARRLLEEAVVGPSPSISRPVDPADLWDENLVTKFGEVGVVPVGTPVLHSPTAWYSGPAAAMQPFADRMLRTMEAARGSGLAANQVGAGVRALAHDMPQCAPSILINPQRVAAHGAAARSEACLSLNVPNSHADVLRWQKIAVVADLLDGNQIVVEADEMLARVLQHELDHLDGIEYVQRMSGDARDNIYATLEAAEVPMEWLPPIGPEVDVK
jgi:peptide deformylase